jgi:DNA-directed RNA polymerase alpha subunit
LALPLLLLAGCAETLDKADLEGKLKREVGARAESVACPADVEVQKGKRFDCTVTEPGGGEFKVSVTIENDRGRLRVMVPPPR